MKKIAVVFPGQGSQSVGMLDAWGGRREVSETLRECSEALGLDLPALIQSGPTDLLNRTVNTQPVMVATSVAIFRALQADSPIVPAMAAGHSVGEFSALAAADALHLSHAVQLVRCRAEAMTKAVPDGVGGMAAVIGLDDEVVRQLCQEWAHDEVLEPVNYNAPGQVVVAGHQKSLERLKQPARAAGAKMVMTLPVSGPFHSRLMAPAAQTLSRAVANCPIGEPRFPVLQNATLALASAHTIPDALVAQLTRPVPWTDTIRTFLQQGITHLLEIGPGSVLTNLSRRIAPEIQAFSVSTPAGLDAALEVVAG